MSGILLNQRSAEEKYDSDPPLQRVVPRGELVLEIPPKDRITRNDGSPSHNYCLYNNNAVTLYDDGIGVAPLERAELDYLLAITDPQKRIVQYLEPGKLKWIMELKHGVVVSFRLPQGSNTVLMPKGRVKYYGAIPGHEGVMFGIEILDRDCRGKGNSDGSPYFQCGRNNAVYVPMDKIIKLRKTADEPIKYQPEPAASTRSKTERKDKSLLDKAKETFGMGAAPFTATSRLPADYDSRFSIDDCVVIQTAHGIPVRGWVRWVGPLKMSISAGGITVSAVGIETDKPVNVMNEFPDTHLQMTGSHGQQLFTLERGKNHGRLFLPEPLVLHAEQYAKQKQVEGTFEAQEAKKWEMSLDEYREQMQIVAETKRKKESQIRGNDQQEKTSAAGVGALDDPVYRMQHQQRQEDLERQRRACELENTPEDDNFEVIEILKTNVTEGNYVNVSSFSQPHVGQNRPREQLPSSLPSPHTADHNDTSSPNQNRFHRLQNDQHYHHQQEYSLTHGNSASHDVSQLTKGTLVKVQEFNGHQCLTGIIQWIGTLPHHEGIYAGVELDQVLHGCSDGIFQGRRFFFCPSGMGLFCLLSALQLDERYMEPNQVPAAQRQYGSAIDIHDPYNQSIGIGIQNNPDKISFDSDQLTRNQQDLNKIKEECKILQQSQKELEKDLQHRIAEHETTKRSMRTLQDTYRQVQAEKETVLIEKERIVAEKEGVIAGVIAEKEAALIEKEGVIAEKEGVIAEKEGVIAEKEGVIAEKDGVIAEKEGVIAEMKQTAENFVQSWKINHKDVTLTETELGRGGWGHVRVGVFREQRVAVKQLYNIIVSEDNLAVMNREINTMSRLRHPNLLLFIGAVLDHPSGNPLIITEIMDTSLRSAYEKGQITEESVKLSILRDTASALNYLHCHPAGAIIHRDVSSANVLLETRGTNQWRAKLSDFGSANEAHKAITQAPGAQVYAAPESLTSIVDDKEQPQTTKMDVYSYGIMVCELMTCQFPSSPAVFRSMLQSVSPTIRQIVQDCVSKIPEKRPTIQQVIRSLDELINHK